MGLKLRSGTPALLLVLAILLPLTSALDDTPTFRVSATGAGGPELNLGVTSTGVILVGGWGPLARSFDDGLTWDDPRITGNVLSADRVLIVDKSTDRVFVDDTTLGCTILSWSDDLGETWLSNAGACGGGVTDHQKIAVSVPRTPTPITGQLYENLVWVCANGLSHTDCAISRDGGLTFAPTAPHAIGCAFHGAMVADADGVLYVPTAQCGLRVRSTANEGVTWIERVLPASRFPASDDTPDLAVTPDGTIYLFYTTDDWTAAFARSSNGGLSWQGPFHVPLVGAKSGAFPSIVAGNDGKIALSFYATTDQNGAWSGNPGDAPASTRWHGYVAIITDAASAAPTIAPVQVTDHPLQYGCLSKLGGCLNNIADYMDVDVGPDGRVYAVYTDGCPATCDSASESKDDAAVVAVQTGGPTLL